MYIVTFYSFKGGVGRALALVNAAVSLAQQGRRVLMVDFDLEAPGLTSFDLCKNGASIPGIIDFVEHYNTQGGTPDIGEYLFKCELVSPNHGGELYLMPAGLNDFSYGRRLSQIDWTALYREKNGYLMIEDMKEQWRNHLDPDYVLIDSRTGHTEESGICTRQLPDAVVILFFPNEQNLTGLRTVVHNIRSQSAPRTQGPILHFVTSNVPDLDDEDRILHQRLEKFKKELRYDALRTIHHYPSLALLNQEIFVIGHPRSRLASEYREIVASIIEENPADRQGSLALLRRLRASNGGVLQAKLGFERLDTRLTRIREEHAGDGEITTAIAGVYMQIGQVYRAKILLDAALKEGFRGVEVYRQLFFANLAAGDQAESTEDLIAALNTDDAGLQDVMTAFGILQNIDPQSLSAMVHTKAFQKLSENERLAVGNTLMSTPGAIGVAEEIFRGLSEARTDRGFGRVGLSLCLMFNRKFKEVLELLGPRNRVLTGGNVEVPDVFNYAMAEWALSGAPKVDLINRFIEASDAAPARRDPNFLQCRALAFWAVGDREKALVSLHEARARIESLLVPTFSAWRYLTVPPSEFQRDLDAIEKLINGEALRPAFMG
jgi:MinD-like ATPase involved in chromosome partitioning or flagellar assembly